MRDVMAEIKAPGGNAKPVAPVQAQQAQKAPVATVAPQQPAAPTTAAAATAFPDTWRALVDAWKLRKPLQARKLEEVHPVVFSAAQITIAVSETGFASKSLLQRDEQLKVMEQFRELFGFTGQLSVVAKAEAESDKAAVSQAASPAPSPAPAAAHTPEAPRAAVKDAVADAALPDTILSQKEREGAERRRQLVESARTAAFTQEVLAVFDASIEDVTIRE
jgi:hypothetical protein